MENNEQNFNIDDKLFKVKSFPSEESHLVLDNEKCKNCISKICESICPANVYEWSEEKQEILVRYENCLECGACKIACEQKAINWQYPQGNRGVIFKRG